MTDNSLWDTEATGRLKSALDSALTALTQGSRTEAEHVLASFVEGEITRHLPPEGASSDLAHWTALQQGVTAAQSGETEAMNPFIDGRYTSWQAGWRSHMFHVLIARGAAAHTALQTIRNLLESGFLTAPDQATTESVLKRLTEAMSDDGVMGWVLIIRYAQRLARDLREIYGLETVAAINRQVFARFERLIAERLPGPVVPNIEDYARE